MGADANPQFIEDWEVVCALVRRLRRVALLRREGSEEERAADEGRFEEVCAQWNWGRENSFGLR